MTRALSLSTRSGALSRSRTRPYDKVNLLKSHRRRDIWTQARGESRDRKGGKGRGSSGDDASPEEKNPEIIIEAEVTESVPTIDPKAESKQKQEPKSEQKQDPKQKQESKLEAKQKQDPKAEQKQKSKLEAKQKQDPKGEPEPKQNPKPDSKGKDDVEEDAVGPWTENRQAEINELKTRLLTTVAGFDRGFAAIPRDVAKVRSIVESLETLSGSIDLTGETTIQPDAKETFNGTWKLIFSSNFDTGNQSKRPGANLPLSPFTFGPVYQVVDTKEGLLDNVVELLVTGIPRLPWSPSNAVPRVRLTLRHEMTYSMSIVNINLKSTSVKLLDSGFDLPPLTTRPIPLSLQDLTRRTRAGEFSLVYLDDDLRITEAHRSELRIFVKTNDLED
eukprot:g8420.t1